MTEAARSYTVVGAGAVGLLYGTRFAAAAGHPVRWLVRSGVRDIAAHGIEVTTEGRRLHIAPDEVEVYTAPHDVPASDVVIVATKTTANDQLVDLVTGVCAPGATVALFQNGLGAEQRIRDEVPDAGAVLGAMCFVCVHRIAPGRAEHLDYGPVTLAPLDHLGVPEAAKAVGDDLDRAGVTVVRAEDLGVARWRKLVWNIPFNGLCTTLQVPTDVLLAMPSSRQLVADVMDEVIAAANATGSPVPSEFRDQMLEDTDAMASYEPSMLLDRRAGRPLEIEAIYDLPAAAARAAGAPMVRAEALASMLHVLDRR